MEIAQIVIILVLIIAAFFAIYSLWKSGKEDDAANEEFTKKIDAANEEFTKKIGEIQTDLKKLVKPPTDHTAEALYQKRKQELDNREKTLQNLPTEIKSTIEQSIRSVSAAQSSNIPVSNLSMLNASIGQLHKIVTDSQALYGVLNEYTDGEYSRHFIEDMKEHGVPLAFVVRCNTVYYILLDYLKRKEKDVFNVENVNKSDEFWDNFWKQELEKLQGYLDAEDDTFKENERLKNDIKGLNERTQESQRLLEEEKQKGEKKLEEQTTAREQAEQSLKAAEEKAKQSLQEVREQAKQSLQEADEKAKETLESYKKDSERKLNEYIQKMRSFFPEDICVIFDVSLDDLSVVKENRKRIVCSYLALLLGDLRPQSFTKRFPTFDSDLFSAYADDEIVDIRIKIEEHLNEQLRDDGLQIAWARPNEQYNPNYHISDTNSGQIISRSKTATIFQFVENERKVLVRGHVETR